MENFRLVYLKGRDWVKRLHHSHTKKKIIFRQRNGGEQKDGLDARRRREEEEKQNKKKKGRVIPRVAMKKGKGIIAFWQPAAKKNASFGAQLGGEKKKQGPSPALSSGSTRRGVLTGEEEKGEAGRIYSAHRRSKP